MTFVEAPTPIVVDASIATAMLTEPEDPAESLWLDWLVRARPLLAPPHVILEVANALIRGKRLAAAEASVRLSSLEGSGLEIVDRSWLGGRASLDLAERHGLTVYDAAYLWLAIDVDGELATRDLALIRAAQAEGVPLALG